MKNAKVRCKMQNAVELGRCERFTFYIIQLGNPQSEPSKAAP